MKKYFLLLLTHLSVITFYGQNIAVAADKMNVLYVGIDNSITIAAENCYNKSLVVIATNGKLIKDNGQYLFRSETVGATEITVYKKEKGKLIKLGSTFFRLKAFHSPFLRLVRGGSLLLKLN